MRHKSSYLLSLLLLLAGCIRNDIPYPVVVGGFSSLEVEGAASVSIDPKRQVVDIVLEEATDIYNVRIKSVVYTDPMVKPSWDIVGVHDLSQTLKLTLSTYSDYNWEIRTTQPIERHFSISSQVGESVIDVTNRRVVAKVAASANLNTLDILSLKLGPAGISAYTPEPSTIHDFSNVQPVLLVYRDVRELWNIYIEKSTTTVRFSSVNVWTKVAWLGAEGVAGQENGFRIRDKGTQEWSEVPDVQHNGGSFSAKADKLKADTEYEVIAYSGKDVTDIRSFRTEDEVQLPNSGFETWSKAESDKYYSFFDPESPNPALQTKWWCSGNKGSTTVGSTYTITMPCTDDKVEGESSLLMASAYVVIKFAAGNIFSGEFDRTIGTSGGVIRLGRPFTHRPQKITLWLKYKAGIITDKTFGGCPEDDPVKVGDRDRGSVWVALGDWDYRTYGGTPESPLELNTTDKSTFFNPEADAVIAYGRFVAEQDYDDWVKVEIPLEYRSYSRKPTHIVISAASSILGDYFTGSADSRMWIDDLRLEY